MKYAYVLLICSLVVFACQKANEADISVEEGGHSYQWTDGTVANTNGDLTEGTYLTTIPKTAEPSDAFSKQSKKEAQARTVSEKEEAPVQKMLVKNGDLHLDTENINSSMAFVKKTAKRFNADIYKETQSEYSYERRVNMVLKINADKFDDLLDAILEGEEAVVSKNIVIDDVTEQYIDLAQRLKTKEILRNRLQGFLKNAKTIEEMLKIEDRISSLTEEIESVQGRMKYLRSQVSKSSLNLTITQEIEASEPVWKEDSFFKKAGKGLSNGWDGIKVFLLLLLNLWPLLLVAAAIFWWFKRRK